MIPNRRRLLVVDDDPEIREILALVLDAEGWDVTAACDGVEALELLEADRSFALVVVDLMMPRMGGVELVRQLQLLQAPASIPVVVLSGDISGPAIARELGVAAHLGKPIDLAVLTATLRDALARTRAA